MRRTCSPLASASVVCMSTQCAHPLVIEALSFTSSKRLWSSAAPTTLFSASTARYPSGAWIEMSIRCPLMIGVRHFLVPTPLGARATIAHPTDETAPPSVTNVREHDHSMPDPATSFDLDASPPGWNEHWATTWNEHRTDGLVPCRVTRIDKGGITVAEHRTDERLVIAAKAVRRVVVGDVCGLDPDAGRIESILPRLTVFERRSPGVSRDQMQLQSRAVAANMDLVYVLQPLDPGLNPLRLARELVLAWQSGAQPVVVLTKTDLVPPDEIERQVADARRFAPGVPIACTSTRTTADSTSWPTCEGPATSSRCSERPAPASRRSSTRSPGARCSSWPRCATPTGGADTRRPPARSSLWPTDRS